MKSFYLYVLQSVLCSGGLLALYKILLERRISFRLCRMYLLAAVAVSAVIPALRIPVYPAVPAVVLPVTGGMADWPEMEPLATVPVVEATPAVDGLRLLADVLRVGYAGAAVVLFALFVVRVVAIGRLRRRARLTDCRDYVLAEHATVQTPFSFLRTVYLGDGFEGRRRAIVLCHEASHVRHGHSVERLAMEVMLCLLWFNPFAWMAARWLREVQEWEADRDVLNDGYDLAEYRMTLFSQLFGYNPDMTCGLSHSFTKNRFLMMTRNKWGRFAGWRVAAALPVVGGMLCLCAFTTREGDTADNKTTVVHIVSEPAKAANPQIFVGADGAVSLNGDAVTLDELETKLKTFRAGLPADGLADIYVELTSTASTPMIAIAEVKNVLRRVSLLRLRYCNKDGSITRMLSPLSGGSGKVEVVDVVPERNDLLVLVDKTGHVSLRSNGSSANVSLEELSGRISDFVSGKTGNAKRELKSFDLPDGRKVDYPVSCGLVFLSTELQTPYDSFVSVQQAITAGFNKVRDAVVREWFDTDFASLGDDERRLVWRAVPTAVIEAERQ